jgi:hypothetical protein
MSLPEYRDSGVVVGGRPHLQLSTNTDTDRDASAAVSIPCVETRNHVLGATVPPPQSMMLFRSAYFIRSLKLEAFNFRIKWLR